MYNYSPAHVSCVSKILLKRAVEKEQKYVERCSKRKKSVVKNLRGLRKPFRGVRNFSHPPVQKNYCTTMQYFLLLLKRVVPFLEKCCSFFWKSFIPNIGKSFVPTPHPPVRSPVHAPDYNGIDL